MSKAKFLIKTDRFAAWVLFAGMLLYFISGYGMTKGLIDATLATKLHLDYLSWIVVLAFTLHTSLAIRLAFIRWKILNPLTTTFLFAFYLAFVGGFIYIDRYYTKEKTTTPTATPAKTVEAQNSAVLPNSTQTETVFTTSTLAKFNGQNGQKAYVAVEGVVYDVSSVFVDGGHFTHIAGQELTVQFFSRHGASAITKYPRVGVLR